MQYQTLRMQNHCVFRTNLAQNPKGNPKTFLACLDETRHYNEGIRQKPEEISSPQNSREMPHRGLLLWSIGKQIVHRSCAARAAKTLEMLVVGGKHCGTD